jgi:hypothetical protein
MLASEGHPTSFGLYIKSERAVAMTKKKKTALIFDGICPCGGKLVTSEWTTKLHRKGRTTCNACGRTELKTENRE